jgi:hypothetical protein
LVFKKNAILAKVDEKGFITLTPGLSPAFVTTKLAVNCLSQHAASKVPKVSNHLICSEKVKGLLHKKMIFWP